MKISIFRFIINKPGSFSSTYVIDKSDLEKWIEMTESSKLKLLRAQVTQNEFYTKKLN